MIRGRARFQTTRSADRHPAKFARGLIRRIYQHAKERGWIGPGAVVVDPFAGVGLGALDAQVLGCRWIGCELEPRFVALGNENLALWQRKYGHWPGWGSAVLLQGDSRNLAAVVGEQVSVVVSSPPYAESIGRENSIDYSKAKDPTTSKRGSNARDALGGPYGVTEGQLGAMKEGSVQAVIGSPPFSGAEQPCASQSAAMKDYHAFTRGDGTKRDSTMLGGTEGQLAALPAGSIDAVVSSPPFGDSDARKPGPALAQSCAKHGVGTSHAKQDWTPVAENLAALPAGQVADAIVGSPPFEQQQSGGGIYHTGTPAQQKTGNMRSPVGYRDQGNASGQLGNSTGETFWSAASIIVAQCHQILRPGGVAIWVLKDFVRKGQRVPFSDDWQRLCEAAGFRLVCRHRAMLVKVHGRQRLIDGGEEVKTTSRKSFFRRLAEAKGSPKIDYEDIECFQK